MNRNSRFAGIAFVFLMVAMAMVVPACKGKKPAAPPEKVKVSNIEVTNVIWVSDKEPLVDFKVTNRNPFPVQDVMISLVFKNKKSEEVGSVSFPLPDVITAREVKQYNAVNAGMLPGPDVFTTDGRFESAYKNVPR